VRSGKFRENSWSGVKEEHIGGSSEGILVITRVSKEEPWNFQAFSKGN